MEKLYLNTKYVKQTYNFDYIKLLNEKMVEDYLCFDTYKELASFIANHCFDELQEISSYEQFDVLFMEQGASDYDEWSERLTEQDYKIICDNYQKYENIKYIAFDVDKEISLFKNDTKELLSKYTSFEQRAIVLYHLDCPYFQIEDNVKEQLLSDSPEKATIGNDKIFKY